MKNYKIKQGVEAVCRVLTVFWETIPARRASNLLQTLVNELAHDKSSAHVRAAVLRGLTYMMQEPLALPALKEALPHLRMSIHDRSPLVRTATLDMLKAISQVRGWKFKDVCPADHVLERVAQDADNAAVATAVCNLLLPSVFPLDVGAFFFLRSTMWVGNGKRSLTEPSFRPITRHNCIVQSAWQQQIRELLKGFSPISTLLCLLKMCANWRCSLQVTCAQSSKPI